MSNINFQCRLRSLLDAIEIYGDSPKDMKDVLEGLFDVFLTETALYIDLLNIDAAAILGRTYRFMENLQAPKPEREIEV